MIRRLAGLFVTALVLTGCGGGSSDGDAPSKPSASSPTPSPETPDAALKAAVADYSKAYLTGDGATAYALLSKRCQEVMPLSDFASLTEQAKDQYGDVAIDKLTVKVDGAKAIATYTYPVATINQTDEPWVDEGGWKNDDC